MPKAVFWSPSAKMDYENVLNYLNQFWNNSVVLNFIALTDEKLNFIATHPKQFPLINKKKKIRKCVLTKHNSIFYIETSTTIELLRIFDTRQNPLKLKV